MIQYRTTMIRQEVPETIVCDRCKAENEIDGVDQPDMIEVRHEFGYGSSKDGIHMEFDLCENCLDEIIKKMNIEVREYENWIK